MGALCGGVAEYTNQVRTSKALGAERGVQLASCKPRVIQPVIVAGEILMFGQNSLKGTYSAQ